MENGNENLIHKESKEYYSNKENVRKKWFTQYGRLSEDNDFYANIKSITEIFNLLDVVADIKLDEFFEEAQRLPDEIIKDQNNEVYIYNDRKISFWPTTSFAAKIIALRKIGYKIPDEINNTVRNIRNETTYGNETIITERVDLDYDKSLAVMDNCAVALIALGTLDEEDRFPSFDKLRIKEGSSLRSGEYEICRLLGEGGSSRVYLSTHKRLGKKLAVKELKPDKYSKELLKNESSLLVSIKNENIPDIYDVFSENGTYYIVMEYIDGQTLDEYLKSQKMSYEKKMELSLQLCNIMSYLHDLDKNIIHSDLKPQNIMVNKDNVPFLIDFGVATSDDSGDEKTTFSEAYTAPEKYSSKFDKRSDIYSFGMILKDIFGNDKNLDPVINKCICYNPEDRYKNFDEVRNALKVPKKGSDEIVPESPQEKSKPKHLRWIIPVAAAGACTGILIPVFATARHTDVGSMTETTAVETTSTVNEAEKKSTAMTEFKKLFEQAFYYAKNDAFDYYLELFMIDESPDEKQSETERIKLEFTTLKNHIAESNVTVSDYQYYYLADADNRYALGVLDTSVYDDDSVDNYSYNLYLPVSEKDGLWKFDYTSETHEGLGNAMASCWPPDILPFFNDDELIYNNRWVDIDDYSWMRSNIIIPGVCASKICFMFQKEDGAILVGVSIKNGLEENQKISEIRISANDAILGEMFNCFSEGDIIPAQESKIIIFEIPPDNIPDKIKEQTWTEPEDLFVELL